jgi:hypothetical protein
MSSKAGPSSASKSKTKSEKKVPKVAEPVKSQMSKETVDSDDDLESRVDDDDAGSESEDNLDSEEDLENVQPKHKANGGGTKSGNATSSGSGSGWPYVLFVVQVEWTLGIGQLADLVESINHPMGWLL